MQRYLVTEIQGYANAQGFDLVLGEGVFFAKGPLDITAQVLAVLATKPASLPAAAPGAPKRLRRRRRRLPASSKRTSLSHSDVVRRCRETSA